MRREGRRHVHRRLGAQRLHLALQDLDFLVQDGHRLAHLLHALLQLLERIVLRLGRAVQVIALQRTGGAAHELLGRAQALRDVAGGVAEAAHQLAELLAQRFLRRRTVAARLTLALAFAHALLLTIARLLPRLLAVPDEAVRYAHALDEVETALAQRTCRLALLMRPTPPRQIAEVADARQSMPAKSTFFHPKLPSGLVIHPLAL